MYMHTFNTCRCIQLHTLDKCRIMHLKYERANMDGDWEGKHEWNTVISYAAHDYEPGMLTCRASRHVPSLQIIVYGRLCTRHKHILPPCSRKISTRHIHAQLLLQIKTCWIMTKPRWGRYSLSPWYWPTLTKSRAALNMDHHMQELAQLSISTNTCGRLAQLWYRSITQLWYRRYSLSYCTCWNMPSSPNVQTHAETCLALSIRADTHLETLCALDTCLHMKIHAQLLTWATHANKRTPLHTGQQIQINAQLLIKAKNLPINADRRSTLSVCWYQPLYADTSTSPWCLQTQADTWHDQPKRMLICTKSWADADTCSHMQSPHWYMTGYVDNTTAQNARQPMQIRAQLSTRANSC
jgi:hypothetical protein